MGHPQPDHVDVTFYAVVTPTWHHWLKDDQDRPILDGARLDRTTVKRPQQVKGDAVVTRLTLRIDAAALLPMQPQAIVHVTADDVEVIEVTAEDPAESGGEQ